MKEYSPSIEEILDHYEELSTTASGDPEVGAENRRLADLALRRDRRGVWNEGWKHAGRVFRAVGTGPRTRNPYEGEGR